MATEKWEKTPSYTSTVSLVVNTLHYGGTFVITDRPLSPIIHCLY